MKNKKMIMKKAKLKIINFFLKTKSFPFLIVRYWRWKKINNISKKCFKIRADLLEAQKKVDWQDSLFQKAIDSVLTARYEIDELAEKFYFPFWEI